MDIGDYNGVHFELGIRETGGLAANFHAADAAITAAMQAHVLQTADAFDAVWEALTPVDTYYMVEHRRILMLPSGLGFEAGWDASDFLGMGLAFYPWFQEFGTYKMSAQPSLGPAFEEIAPQFQSGMSEILSAAIARLNRPL